MEQPNLLAMPEPIEPPAPQPTRPSEARLVKPVRNQIEWVERSLDTLLPLDHQARAIWAFLERLDLPSFYADIKAVADRPGRPASDPRVLLASDDGDEEWCNTLAACESFRSRYAEPA